MKKLSEAELQSERKITWYLPHRFVINAKKPDRLRRVYDASAKFMCQSLNDKIFIACISSKEQCSEKCQRHPGHTT